MHGVVPPKVQDFALLLVELPKESVEAPLDGSTTLWNISHSEFGVSKLAVDKLCPIVQITKEGVGQTTPSIDPQGNTAGY